jgi:CDP-diacylglycerol--glycerol-3-phosphate 3-phosphatidyltransferase
LGSLAIYCILDDLAIYPVVIASLVFGFLVPYIRAKSESYGVSCTVGIAERTERLIIALAAIGFHGLGVPYILAGLMWLLLALSIVTVIQRIVVVRNGLL